MRWKLLVTVLVAVLLVGGGATLVLLRLTGGTGHGATAAARATPTPSAAMPTSTAPAAVPTPSPSPTPTPTPTPSASISGACTGSQLDMVVGAASSASGGQEGVTALIGNDGGTACDLSGTLQAQLLGSSGSALPTSQAATPAGQAWLVPGRVALDPWDPQPGEATALISWRTGDTASGVCSGSAPVVGELSLTLLGGASVTAPVNTYPTLLQGMAPCEGDVQVGTITSVSSAATFTTDAEDAANSDIEEEEGETVTTSCTPTAGQGCLTLSGETLGTDAADFEYQSYGTGGGAVCYAYVYEDAAGWHPLDVLCTQDLAPVDGGTVMISVPGGGCADVHATPGNASSVLSCVSPSTQTTYAVEQPPVYVAETDPTTHLTTGTIWWYLAGLDGWVAQDFIA
ncbi:MAG: hypothetical protein ABSH07_07240 [Candidatus Dormibacteria bacterium]